MENNICKGNKTRMKSASQLSELYFKCLREGTLDKLAADERPEIEDFEDNFSCLELLRLFRNADPGYKDPRTISYLTILANRSLKLLRICCDYLLRSKCITDTKTSNVRHLYKIAANENLLTSTLAASGKGYNDDSVKAIRRYVLMQNARKAVEDELALNFEHPNLIPLIPNEVLSLYKDPWLRSCNSCDVFTDRSVVDSLKPLMTKHGFTYEQPDPLEINRMRSIAFKSIDDIDFNIFFDAPFSLPGAWGEYVSNLFGDLIEEHREMTAVEYAIFLTAKLHAPNIHQSSACLSDLLDLALILDAFPDLTEDVEFRNLLSELMLDNTWSVIHSICTKALSARDEPVLQDDEVKYMIELISRPYLRATFIEGLSRELLAQDRFFDPAEYTVSPEKGLVYLVNSKVACSSIKASMLDEDVPDDYTVHNIAFAHGLTRKELTAEEQGYYSFTFVRNPFARLVSCYESKYHVDRKRYKTRFAFRNYLNGYLYFDEGFDQFVRKICALPYRLMDRHFRSQYYLIFDAADTQFDFIGHHESIEDEFLTIQNKYHLRPLPHLNRIGTDDWMNYYTLETADLVYKTFQKDIEVFGYESSYLDLLSCIQSQAKSK